jgi:hypothetical protein
VLCVRGRKAERKPLLPAISFLWQSKDPVLFCLGQEGVHKHTCTHMVLCMSHTYIISIFHKVKVLAKKMLENTFKDTTCVGKPVKKLAIYYFEIQMQKYPFFQ